MTRYSGGPIPHEQTALRRRKIVRRISMTIGLMIAAFVAAAMVARLFSPQASSSGRQIASREAHKVVTSSQKVITLHQLAEFAVPGVPAPFQLDPVLLDPDGEIVVAVTGNGQISAWSTSTGQPLSTFSTLPDGVPASSQDLGSPMFSADGKEFSVLGDGAGSAVADIWNAATGRATGVPLPFGSSTNPAFYATPGPNGLIAVEYSSGTLGLDPATGPSDALTVVHGGPGSASQLGEPIFSPDGRTIAVSDDLGLIHLVDVPGRRLAGVLTAEKIYNSQSIMNGAFSKEIDSVTFSPDSKLIACGTESGIVRVWDVATGRSVSAFNVSGTAPGGADARPVKTLVFSPDGRTLITSDDADSTLAVWNVTSGREVATMNARSGDIVSAAFTTNGKLVVATTSNSASSQRIEVWAAPAGSGG